MYRLISHQIIRAVTPTRARAFLRNNIFVRQRVIKQDIVDQYAIEMKEGRFRPAVIAITRAPKGTPIIVNGKRQPSETDGIELLMNGQHTCHSGIQSQTSFAASLEQYECKTPDDVWMLFATFDTHLFRTDTQIMAAARGLFEKPELQQTPLATLNKCASALWYVGHGLMPRFHVRLRNKQKKPQLIQQHAEEVLWVAHYPMECQYLLRVPVICAMLTTRRKAKAKAESFWDRVIYGDELIRGTPQHKLHQELSEGNCSERFNVAGGWKLTTAVYSLCIAWWNSYVTGTKRTAVKVRGMKKIPQVEG